MMNAIPKIIIKEYINVSGDLNSLFNLNDVIDALIATATLNTPIRSISRSRKLFIFVLTQYVAAINVNIKDCALTQSEYSTLGNA